MRKTRSAADAGVVVLFVGCLFLCWSDTAFCFTSTQTVKHTTRQTTNKPCRLARCATPTDLGAVSLEEDAIPQQPDNTRDDYNDRADKEQVESSSSSSSNIRPLEQNWWPVTAIVSLDPKRPNALQVLGKKLVAVYSSSQRGGQWHVLDDRCSHRFAPLSEGRLVGDGGGGGANDLCTTIQCAYHGWEFATDTGTCTRVPQQEQASSKGARAVQTYPVRNEAGILWVWTDPTTIALADSVALPISPLVKQQVTQRGNDAVFMRDLPYGMEILGENLLDLSHLPFSHHSVGSLRRALGGYLPTRMLSKEERVENAQWEKDYYQSNMSNNATTTATTPAEPVLPRYQAEIVNAGEHDPIFRGFPKMPGANTSAWTTTIGFYDPCHVRYRRYRGPGQASHVELFLCPTSEGRSRVFLFNVFENPPPMPPQLPLWKMLWKPRVLKSYLEKGIFQPGNADGHLFAHLIFDGDGIFLHKQGNRMQEAGLSFRDYSTPTSADVLLNAYRRFLDAAAQETSEKKLASAVVGTREYGDDLERSVMLDRYNTHTKHCPTCLGALQQTRVHLNRVQQVQTMAQGTIGASTTALMALVILRLAQVSLARALWPVTFASTCLTWLVARTCRKAHGKLQKRIDQFLFEDYVHAEKD